MSELTDNAIAMLRICVHDGTENTAQVYFAQLLNQISAIEEVRDDWYRAWKQEQAARSLADDEVERVKAEGGHMTREDAIRNAFKPNSEFSLHRKPLSETIQGVINERDDALKEVERLKNESSAYLLGYDDGVKQMEAVENKAKWQEKEVTRLTSRLALAERVMRNLAKVLCSPRYDRGDGCGDEEKMLANYGWTKEDTE